MVSLLIGFGLFIWVLKFVGWQGIKNSLLIFTSWKGLVIFGLTLLMMLTGSRKWKEILKGEGINVPFLDLFKVYLAGFSVMFLAPVMFLGGEIFRGYVLKEKNSVPWPKGIASVIIDRILDWTINLVFVFLGVLIFLLMIGSPPRNLIIIFGGVFLFFLFGISFFYFKVIKRESMARFILEVFGLEKFNQAESILEIEKEIFNFFKPQKISMWKSFILAFLMAGIFYCQAFILIYFLGGKIGALSALSILGFIYLAAMIPIPTSLGSHEAIQTFAFTALGLGASLAPAFTMIIRGAELIVALAGAIILYRLGINFLKTTLYKKTNNSVNKNENYH